MNNTKSKRNNNSEAGRLKNRSTRGRRRGGKVYQKGKTKTKDKHEKEQNEIRYFPIEDLKVQKKKGDDSSPFLPAINPAFQLPTKFLPFFTCDNKAHIESTDIQVIEGQLNEEFFAILVHDVEDLLFCDYNEFWSTVFFSPSFAHFIDTFLRYHDRYLVEDALSTNTGTEFELLHNQLFKVTFKVLQRMSTHQESEQHFFSYNYWIKMLYEQRVFDIAKLIDICAIYGCYNQEAVSKMMKSIFAKKFYKDLEGCVTEIELVLDNIFTRVIKITQAPTFNDEDAVDSLFEYLYDISTSLACFYAIHPRAAQVGAPVLSDIFTDRKFTQLLWHTIRCAEIVVPILLEIYNHVKVDEEKQATVKLNSQVITNSFASVANSIISEAYFEKIFSNKGGDANQLLNLMLVLKKFSRTINSKHTSVGFLNKSAVQIAEPNYSSLLATLQQQFAICDSLRRIQAHSILDIAKIEEVVQKIKSTIPTKEKKKTIKIEKPAFNKSTLATKVEQVKNIFAEMGSGFIEACLLEYDLDHEQVIDAICSDTVRGELKDMDRTIEKLPDSYTEKLIEYTTGSKRTNIMYERRNIFDGDEFDVKAGNFDSSRVIYGKKEAPDLLDLPPLDPESKQNIVDSFTPLVRRNLNFHEDDDNEAAYEDEYDDTFDQYANFNVADDTEDALSASAEFDFNEIMKLNQQDSGEKDEEEEEETDQRMSKSNKFTRPPKENKQNNKKEKSNKTTDSNYSKHQTNKKFNQKKKRKGQATKKRMQL